MNSHKDMLKKKGVKFKYPPKPGYVVPLTDDKVFRIFMRRGKNRRFLAKIISVTTDIDYDFLLNNMRIVDSNVPNDNIGIHFNDQDIVVDIDRSTINVEMSNNKYLNKRKNERTAFKFAGNQHKSGEKYEKYDYVFYQICIEDYNIFKNDLLITKTKLVDISSGKYESETDEFIKFHVNLKNIDNSCYNEIGRYFKFFTLDKISDLEDLVEGDEILMDSLEELKNISRNSILMDELEKRELEEYCNKLALEDAHNDGKEIGLSEGKEIGINYEKIEIAKKMLDDGVDVSLISKYSGLTIDEIEKLRV